MIIAIKPLSIIPPAFDTRSPICSAKSGIEVTLPNDEVTLVNKSFEILIIEDNK